MDYFANPALLWGGLISAAMLVAWALGRWQASPPLSAKIPDAVPLRRALRTTQATPNLRTPGLLFCQPQTSLGGADAFDHAMSLIDLHAEISAFRRSERVFATLAPDAVILDCFASGAARMPVAGGVVSQSAGSPLNAADPNCSCGHNCGGYLRASAAPQIRTAQPSPGLPAVGRE